MAQRHLELKIKDSHFNARNRDVGQTCSSELRPLENTRKNGKSHAKTNAERRLHPLDHKKRPLFIVRKHAHSRMTRTRKAKGRNDLRSPSPTGHRKSKGDGKGSDD